MLRVYTCNLSHPNDGPHHIILIKCYYWQFSLMVAIIWNDKCGVVLRWIWGGSGDRPSDPSGNPGMM